MPHPGNSRRRASANFFAREDDGTVRLRIRFDGADASLMEEAAGTTPVMEWLLTTLRETARATVRETREALASIPPPHLEEP